MDAYHALAASYDRLTNDVDYEATVEFYMEILRREGVKPRTCVDLACGTGSVTKILAEKGYDVIGVDLSEEMLTEAFQKVQDMENPPRFVCQPLQELCLPRGVDLAVCALDSLDYIITPADCAASTANSMPFSLQYLPICAMGSTVPVTLDACVHITSFVSGRTVFKNERSVTSLSAKSTSKTSCEIM